MDQTPSAPRMEPFGAQLQQNLSRALSGWRDEVGGSYGSMNAGIHQALSDMDRLFAEACTEIRPWLILQQDPSIEEQVVNAECASAYLEY